MTLVECDWCGATFYVPNAEIHDVSQYIEVEKNVEEYVRLYEAYCESCDKVQRVLIL